MRIMIVEDSPKMRDLIRRFVERSLENVQRIYECSTGAEAIKQYDKHRPDWVLMDIKMEPDDGLMASKEIFGMHPHAKIILVTNYDDFGYRRLAEEIGVHGYVLKENLNEIVQIIEKSN